MLLSDVVATSSAVSGTRSRTRKVALLAERLAAASPDELPAAVAFLMGEPRQDRLDVGWSTLRELEVAPADGPSLTVADVDAAFERLAGVSGVGSRAARRQVLTDLMSRATHAEQAFLRQLVVGELRQGALAGVMAQAVAAATGVEEPLVRRATMLSGDLAAVAADAVAGGAARLQTYRLELFRPIEPMLAKTAATVAEALEATGPASVEAKLDGARVQVHRRGEEVRVYTRNLRDVTDRLPEVVAAVQAFPGDPLVLDGEAITLRPDGRPHPFQVTMGRFGSETDVEALRRSTPLTLVVFDVLHADGRDLIDVPLRERLGVLDEVVGTAAAVDRRLPEDPEAADDFLRATLDAGHEGVMCKALDGVYEAGRRGVGWRKVKPVHTLDLVILAAEWGSGRRRGWLSNLHLGARDPDGGFVMLGKTFKGLTDEMLTWQTERLLELETSRDRHVVHVRPELVAEIALDGVQSSPRYPAGVALRFARVKGYRLDKRPEDADTIATVHAIHRGDRRPTI